MYSEAQYSHGLADERLYLDTSADREISAAEAQGNPHARYRRARPIAFTVKSAHAVGAQSPTCSRKVSSYREADSLDETLPLALCYTWNGVPRQRRKERWCRLQSVTPAHASSSAWLHRSG